MGRVERADHAEADLLNIWLYIAGDSLEAADRVLGKFESAFEVAVRASTHGAGEGELAPNLRHLVISGFTVFYHPLDDGVVIVRVLHNRQDVERSF